MLFRYHDGQGAPFWATAGGELLEGETYRMAAERELAEETGFSAEIGPFLRERDAVYAVTASAPARWIEHYFLVRCAEATTPDRKGWTEEERQTIRNFRWWTLEEMQQEPVESFRPEWLPELLATVQEQAG